jgi:L-histidine N-alpha-methyltransferase
MNTVAHVRIHPSQFPDAQTNQLAVSLRRRQLDHKFLYESHKQTQRWIALHTAFSPSRTDADCAAIYDQAFTACADLLPRKANHLIGLGCGAGQKDSRFLELLGHREKSYTPIDVSVGLALLAREKALTWISESSCRPLVCDLGAENLGAILEKDTPSSASRMLTFFGMVPNFEPSETTSLLKGLLRSGDYLLFSANLAPGDDYSAGVRRILPLYDNEPTRDWLMTFLYDLGCERGDGNLNFEIESGPAPERFERIVADFTFQKNREFMVNGETFKFLPGDALRLFFSYRHTPALIRSWFGVQASACSPAILSGKGQHNSGSLKLELLGEWVAPSGEEGVFLFHRS